MMETAVELRERARKCYEAARSALGDQKLILLKAARSWAQLAEDIEEFQRILGPSSSKTVDDNNTAKSIKNGEAT